MEFDYKDLINNDLCKLHSTYLKKRAQQIPILTHNQLSIHTTHPSFIYLPYGGNIKSNYCQIEENNKLNNNDKSSEFPFERTNLFGCYGNILREKDSPECSYPPIGWQNNISQCQYNARYPIRSYRSEENRINGIQATWHTQNGFNTQNNCNTPKNCNTQNNCNTKNNYTQSNSNSQNHSYNTQNESRNTEEFNFRPTTKSQTISQDINILRIQKPDIRTGTDNYKNLQKIINEQQYSYGRRESFGPEKQNVNERYIKRDIITGERLHNTRRPTEHNQFQKFYESNSSPKTGEMQEKIKFNETIIQNGYKPRTQQQENYIGDTGRSPLNRYCSTGNEIGEIMSGYRKSIEEELSKIGKGPSPYERKYNNPLYTQNTDCRRLPELQRFSRKNNEKTDCTCCCHIKHDNNQNNIYNNFNPLDGNGNNDINDDASKIPSIRNLNQFRNKMEQRLLCHKHYCSDSDRASDDDFNAILLKRYSSPKTSNNIFPSTDQSYNNKGENLSCINESPSRKNILQQSKEEGNRILKGHQSNSHLNRIYSSNPNSSDDENSPKYRRSVLQGPRGEGGRLLIPNNSNNGYTSTDDESIYKKRPNIVKSAIGESRRLLIERARNISPYPMSSDDERTIQSHRSILQCARGEGGNFLKSNSLDPINNRKSSSNIFSSDDETTLAPRRSILQGPRGEGGRILRPTNSNNYPSCRNFKSTISSSEDENIFNSCKLTAPATNLQSSSSGIYAKKINIIKNQKSNLSSSEDETYMKIIPRILEGHRNNKQLLERNNFNVFGNNRNRTPNQLSSGDSKIQGTESYNWANSYSSANSGDGYRLGTSSNFRPVNRISPSPSRSILFRSLRGNGSNFSKSNDSHDSSSGSHRSSLFTLCMDSEDESARTRHKPYPKFYPDITPQPVKKKKITPNYKNFTKKNQLPFCEAFDVNTPKIVKYTGNSSNHINSLSDPSTTTNIQSIPVRRTNSASPKQISTTTLSNKRYTSITGRTTGLANNKKNITPKPIELDVLRPTIFRYLNALDNLKTINQRSQVKKSGGGSIRSISSRKTIPLKKTDNKSSCGSFNKGQLGKCSSEAKKINITSKVSRHNSMPPFKYR